MNEVFNFSLLVISSLHWIILFEFFFRFCVFLKELKYRKLKYQGKTKDVFIACFTSSAASKLHYLIFATFFFLSTFVTWHWNHKNLAPYEVPIQLLILFISWKFLNYCGIIGKYLTIVKCGEISTDDNVGKCLAFSYYYGFLKIILPPLKELMAEFEKEQKIEFIYKKYLILMPETCYVPKRLDDHYPDRDLLKYVLNLRPVEVDRAGNVGRKYENPVYKIMMSNKDNEPLYFVGQIPSFLLALQEMCERENITKVPEATKVFWVKQACQTLRDLCEDDDICKDLIDIIPYKGKDDNGDPQSISKILYQHVFKSMSREVEEREKYAKI